MKEYVVYSVFTNELIVVRLTKKLISRMKKHAILYVFIGEL